MPGGRTATTQPQSMGGRGLTDSGFRGLIDIAFPVPFCPCTLSVWTVSVWNFTPNSLHVWSLPPRLTLSSFCLEPVSLSPVCLDSVGLHLSCASPACLDPVALSTVCLDDIRLDLSSASIVCLEPVTLSRVYLAQVDLDPFCLSPVCLDIACPLGGV